MNVRTILTTALAVALVSVPVTALAQYGPGGPGGGAHQDHLYGFAGFGGHGGFEGGPGVYRLQHRMPRMAEFLGLTEDQVSRIEAILEEEVAAMEPLQAQLHETVQAYRDSHDPGLFDEPGFRSFLEEIAPLKIDIEVAGARAMSRVFNVLTPEQREQMQDLRDQFGRHGAGRRRGGGATGP